MTQNGASSVQKRVKTKQIDRKAPIVDFTDHQPLDDRLTEERTDENPFGVTDYGVWKGLKCKCGKRSLRGFMIACDKCNTWYHAQCVYIKKKLLPDEFVCTVCDPSAPKVKYPTGYIKKKKVEASAPPTPHSVPSASSEPRRSQNHSRQPKKIAPSFVMPLPYLELGEPQIKFKTLREKQKEEEERKKKRAKLELERLNQFKAFQQTKQQQTQEKPAQRPSDALEDPDMSPVSNSSAPKVCTHSHHIKASEAPQFELQNLELQNFEDEDEALHMTFDEIIQHSSMNLSAIPPMEPPASIKTKLHHYQKQFLYWATQREADTAKYPHAGLLADDMGLGKTLQILSLVMTNRPPKKSRAQATLIVCNLSTLAQWQHEIKKHITDRLATHVYHGQDRNSGVSKQILQACDIVLTTYGTLTKEMLSGTKGALLPVMEWFRVVMDEAQEIRNSKSQVFRAVMNMQAVNRWCLTGTPIQNTLEDLWSLWRFLGVDMSLPEFKTKIARPWLSQDPHQKRIGHNNLFEVLDVIMLRRKNDQEVSGKLLLDLPPPVYEDCQVEMLHHEVKFYQARWEEAQQRYREVLLQRDSLGFSLQASSTPTKNNVNNTINNNSINTNSNNNSNYTPNNNNTANNNNNNTTNNNNNNTTNNTTNNNNSNNNITKNNPPTPTTPLISPFPPSNKARQETMWSQVLTSLLRARQACDHFYLVLSGENKTRPAAQLGMEDDASGNEERNALVSQHNWLQLNHLMRRETGMDIVDDRHLTDFVPSSKIVAVATRIANIQNKNPSDKILVFSQWTSFLSLLDIYLRAQGYGTARLDGSSSSFERDKVVTEMSTSTSTTILLASTKAANCGLNLTFANHVLLADPWWNPGVERQAVCRAWRQGQTKIVNVVRFWVVGSVEERVREVAKRKERVGLGVLREEVQRSGGGASVKSDDLSLIFG